MKIKYFILIFVFALNSCVITKNGEVEYPQCPTREVTKTKLYNNTRNLFGDPNYDWDIYWSYFPFMLPATIIVIGGDTVAAPLKILYGLGTYPFAKEKEETEPENQANSETPFGHSE